MRRRVLDALGGYDPEIFVWANEIEFMVRFYDRGFRHLYLPEITAVHMKAPQDRAAYVASRGYVLNSRHFAYIAAKLLRPRDAAGALVALLALNVRDALRSDPGGWRGLPASLRGFASGLRHRHPVRPEVSRVYRRDFHTFASPFAISRPLPELLVAVPAEWQRERYYPSAASTLQL